jgi:hypothetical protein
MTTLSYAGRVVDARQQRVAGWFFRGAVVLGVLPMVMGVGIVLLYWATYWQWLVTAGLWLLAVGTGMVLLGVAFLIVWGVMARRVARAEGGKFNAKAFWLALLLLLANFVVAVPCVVAGWHLAMQTMVEVINQTGAPLDECTIVLPNGIVWTEHGVPAGGRIRKKTSQYVEGAVVLKVQQGAVQVKVTLTGYASGPPGPHVRAYVKPGLVTDVKELN